MKGNLFGLGSMVFVLVFLGATTMVVYSNRSKNFQEHQALTLCQDALKRAAPVLAKVRIPEVQNSGNAEEFVFIWDATKAIKMGTQRDEVEATTAYCKFDKSTKRVIFLTFGDRRPI